MYPFSFVEVAAYNLIRAVPLLFFAFYPFRDKRRFSAGVTAFIYEVILFVWMCLSLINAYYVTTTYSMAFVEVAGLILIMVLYVAALRGHPGKMIFFCFMLVNVGYMLTVAGKCLEGYLFPEYVMDKYCWSASLSLVVVSPFILIPVYYFLKWEKENLAEERQPAYVWQYCWLVPMIFYLIWSHEFYGSGSSLQWSLKIANVLFLGVVNVTSFLIYYLILRMLRDNARYMQLQEENHVLTLQLMQYDDLNQRIAAARQGRHDMRHHILAMENFVNAGDIGGLRKYLIEIGNKYQLEEALTFCSNTTVNGVLLFFAREAREAGINYSVSLGVPEDIRIAKTDLSILFGNLLENAVEACQRQRAGEKKIRVRGQTAQNTFTLAIDNTYETAPEADKKGRFRSMKHSGTGIGTESVKAIVARYGGVIEFDPQGDLFCVSIMMYF